MNQIFEVNIINNLQHESVFVQIRSNKTLSQHTLPYQHASTKIANKNPHINKANIITSHMNSNINRHHKQPALSGLSGLSDIYGTTTPVGQYQRYINQHRGTYMNMGVNMHTINVPDVTTSKIITKEEKEPNIVPVVINPLEKGLDIGSPTKVYPGFVRIAPFQSLPMPVVMVKNGNSYIVFLTVYVEDSVSNKIICLANQLPINRQNIEIKRAENGSIIFKEICYTHNRMDNLLHSWSIPQYLCNSMKNNGWDNISLWHEITETDLIDMGFQRGHRLIFFDKFTDLLCNQNNVLKYVLKSWDLPIYLYSNMVENGWIDPSDWAEITDYHFKKMGFKPGHIVKFRKQIKNDHHLVAFQNLKMKLESKTTNNPNQNSNVNINQHYTDKKVNQNDTNNNIPQIIANNFNNNTTSYIPTFKTDPTTITHEQFWYDLDEMKLNETYYLETKSGNNPWLQREEITDTKRRNICELDMNTTYFVRIKSENKRSNKIIYSQIAAVKTKDEKWKHIHLPKIPDFKYAVSSNNKQITVEFYIKSLIQIKQTKFDERYSLDIGLSKDDGLERIVNWKNVATLRKDKLVYIYNVNDQKDADWVHVGISARNDLGQRYNQCTCTRQFPFSQVIKTINTTKHGNNLQFDESMTTATKIDQDYKYSTFAFGQPVTREMCNRYDMYVKVNKLESDCFMGFAPSLESVIDWNQALGYGGNKNSSVGVLANKSSADFAVYNKDDDKRHIYHAAGGIKKWDDGSVFLLSFDFLNDDCNIYLNENDNSSNNDHNTLDQNRLLKSIKLNQIKSVVPSFSLNSQGDSIQVVKWRLY